MNGGLKLMLYGAFLSLALVSGYNLKRVLSDPSPLPAPATGTNRLDLNASTNATTNIVKLVSTGVRTNLPSATNRLTTNAVVSANVETSADSSNLEVDLSSTGAMQPSFAADV